MTSFDNQRINPGVRNWDGEQDGGIGDNWKGWLSEHSKGFDAGVLDLKKKLDEAYQQLLGDPSNPTFLMDYQQALSAYNMYRMTQSNSVKNLADMQKQNARNLG